jgi:hypothetical protein
VRRIIMSQSLEEILDLVGNLNDAPGINTPRERFRRHLSARITETGRIRDYVEECLRKTGDQYNKALQDLVNHIGNLLGFEVEFGRYRGVQNEIGFDGLWKSSFGNTHIVVEVKTTEAYTIKTSTILGYINDLVSAKKIPDRDQALGLYVIGRPDPEVKQLENSIIAEKLIGQLRIISVQSLLTLAELISDYDVTHQDILSVLMPSRPPIDPLVVLISRLVTEPADEEPVLVPIEGEGITLGGEPAYWLTPVRSDETGTAEEGVRELVGQEGIYAFGERTPGRKHLKPGDWICFYASGTGVIAHARVASEPKWEPSDKVSNPELYPWTFRVDSAKLYLDDPVVIDLKMREHLKYFEGRDLSRPWAWFVQGTRSIGEADFKLLTHQTEKSG